MSLLELQGELELIDQARRGSVDAFEQLVLHYQDRLYRFLLARAANRADAEDALQEAFVAVFRYLPSYRNRYRFSTWLFTIAIRQLNRLNKRQPESLDRPESVACGLPGPEQMGIQSEHRLSLWKTARTCLSDAQLTALWLFYVEELPLTEIGIAMKRPVGWVKVNLMRARRRLSLELPDDHFEYAVTRQEVTL